MPPELREYLLCRYIYHCTPSELDREDQERVMAHWICYQQDEIAANMRAGAWKSTRDVKPKKVK